MLIVKIFFPFSLVLQCVLLVFFSGVTTPASAGERSVPPVAGDLMTLQQDANLREGPDIQKAVIVSLRKGTEVVEMKQKFGWSQVDIPAKGISGWIHSSLLAEKKVGKQAAPKDDSAKPADRPQKKNRKDSVHNTIRLGVIDVQEIIEHSLKGKELRAQYKEQAAQDPSDASDMEQELITEILYDVKEIVEAYAEEKGFTHVLNRNAGGLVFVEKSFDITSEVIERYDRSFRRN